MRKAVIISAPSGSGKTSIVKCLLKEENRLGFSISATSRKKRAGEIDGKDYYFISRQDFLEKIEHNEFVEWQEVYKDVFYGTLKIEVERIWNQGKAVIFDVDVKGGINLKNYYGDKAISIFIAVRDAATLENRLRNRKTETEKELKARLAKSADEMKFAGRFDSMIINDDLRVSCLEACKKVGNFLNGED
ncbi:MAG TPA: guanylate kinase [Cyclobacteriaceae bacterium]|nr:guanylate kinase [Cyclobacteriaceae bacterium]